MARFRCDSLILHILPPLPISIHVPLHSWLQTDDIREKERDIADGFTKDLSVQKFCSNNCDVSAEYIADSHLLCSKDTNENIVLYGRIVTTPTHTSSELLEELQKWVLTEPLLIVKGVQLRVLPCQAALTDPENLDCIAANQKTPDTPPQETPDMPPQETPDMPGDISEGTGSEGRGIPVGIIGGAAAGGILLILILIVIAAILMVRKQRRKQRNNRLNVWVGEREYIYRHLHSQH